MPGDIVRSNHDIDPPGLYARKKGWHVATLEAALTLDDTYPNNLRLDPGGAHRDITLPAVATNEGVEFYIVNAADAGENLVVKNVGGDTIVTVNQNDAARVYCTGSAWIIGVVHAVALS